MAVFAILLPVRPPAAPVAASDAGGVRADCVAAIEAGVVGPRADALPDAPAPVPPPLPKSPRFAPAAAAANAASATFEAVGVDQSSTDPFVSIPKSGFIPA
jgi:hypothetical protein